LVILKVPPGASSSKEIDIFQKYCPIPIEDVRELSHITIMQLLPGILERDLDSFGSAISRIHDIGFKKIEFDLLNRDVKELVSFQKKNGVKCVGISSFGPAVYSFFESKSDRKEMLKEIELKFGDKILKTYLTCADNKGAEIQTFSD
jgi:beta-ribofuranosylaminobenzene 5'-phosphate synthase